jgi:hypothetical protein
MTFSSFAIISLWPIRRENKKFFLTSIFSTGHGAAESGSRVQAGILPPLHDITPD